MAEFIREGCGKRIGVSVCRRVGVCKASSTPSRPPDHYSRVEKQSYFPRRRYADTPTRFPSRRPILIATIYLLFRGQDTRETDSKPLSILHLSARLDSLSCCWLWQPFRQ